MNSHHIAAGPAGHEHGADQGLARRASSFGAAATAYAQHRPDYPLAAIRWALEPVTAATARRLRIIDLGAGTGKLTLQLAGLDLAGGPPEVIAVEPDRQMLGELRRQVGAVASAAVPPRSGRAAAEPRPGVIAASGRAEDIPLPDACADAVLAGQAAHWFDVDLAMPEIARVLRPGGVFAGLWNADDDRVGWVAGLHRTSGRHNVAALSAMTAGDGDAISAWLTLPGQDLFAPLDDAGFEHAQPRTADSLIATMRTHSMFLVREPAEREAVLARVRAYLAATPQTAAGEFLLPLVTLAIRMTRTQQGRDRPYPAP